MRGNRGIYPGPFCGSGHNPFDLGRVQVAREAGVFREAIQARLQIRGSGLQLLHMIRQFYVWGEEVRPHQRQ